MVDGQGIFTVIDEMALWNQTLGNFDDSGTGGRVWGEQKTAGGGERRGRVKHAKSLGGLPRTAGPKALFVERKEGAKIQYDSKVNPSPDLMGG